MSHWNDDIAEIERDRPAGAPTYQQWRELLHPIGNFSSAVYQAAMEDHGRIRELKAQLQEAERKVADRDQWVQGKDTAIRELRDRNFHQADQIRELRSKLEKADQEKERLQAWVDSLARQCQALQEDRSYFQRLKEENCRLRDEVNERDLIQELKGRDQESMEGDGVGVDWADAPDRTVIHTWPPTRSHKAELAECFLAALLAGKASSLNYEDTQEKVVQKAWELAERFIEKEQQNG